MAWLILGSLALLLALLGLSAFARASVAQIRLGLAWFAGLLGAALLVLALLTGRLPQLLWLAVFVGPLAWRWWQGRRLAARFAGPPPGDAGVAAADQVETATLSMRIDPAAGTLSGEVRRGPLAGRDLASLQRGAVLDLLRDCRGADPESVPLLEAWLDRAHPGWRAAGDAGRAAGPMSRDEALAVLGLGEGAGPDAIRAAYLRMMRAAHPDAGGSDWLAARLNEARDILLRE
ncbi:hypothetical protein LPC08_11390 [Roseomonas sp. OT10]|uniref:hypothetical protein n=1 Tax=Roseomonas cutis TaxID=2897332 RepID=UPI001E4D5C34|nr:hypothetical protein [Roseomonas sp. OT10]UFN51156.1 hypothetical protein LPC08_11390 [Roseomonas sp. OT10]